MQTNKLLKSFNLTLMALFVALAGWQATGHNTSQAAPAPVEELKSAAAAKRTLARVGTPNFARIKDARIREAGKRTQEALKALADNTSRAREAVLIADFNRNLGNFKAASKNVIPVFESCNTEYDECVRKCIEDGICLDCEFGEYVCFMTKYAATVYPQCLPWCEADPH